MMHDLKCFRTVFDLIGKWGQSQKQCTLSTLWASAKTRLLSGERFTTQLELGQKIHISTVKIKQHSKTKQKETGKSSYMMMSNELFSKPTSVRASMKPWTKFKLGFL